MQPEQHSSLEASTPQHNAAVSASAGTGKTYLLVSRIIRLLLHGARAEGILALTFTRKAAAEMRQRLYSRLQALALLSNNDLQQELETLGALNTQTNTAAQSKQLIEKARNLYEELLFADQGPRITTFHAFCQDLLRRFPLEANIPAGYELLQNTGLIEETAWDALLLEASQNPDSSSSHALEALFNYCNGLQNTQQALLRGFLDHRSDWWSYTEQQKNAVTYAQQQLSDYLQPKTDPLADFFNAQRCAELEEIMQLLSLHNNATNQKRCQAIAAGIDEHRVYAERFDALAPGFLTASGEPRKIKSSKAQQQKMGIAGEENYLQLNDRVTQAILETRDQIATAISFAINSAWYTAGAALLGHYQKIKQQQQLLDFSDLEWKTYKLLNNSEQALWVQYKLDQKIDHLLLDEFQDTNPTQWNLLLPILQEIASSSTEERMRSVFLVGDTKQSIYSFRRANPQLQLTASRWLEQHLGAKLLPLSKSWRSAPAIIEFINTVFNNEQTRVPLPEFELHNTHQQELWGGIKLLPAVLAETYTAPESEALRDVLSQGRPELENDAHYDEGCMVAAEIKKLIAQKYALEKNDKTQAITYSDIIILLRNRTHSYAIEQALQDEDIPFIGTEKGGLLLSQEIQDLEALLNTLITPFDNLALAQVLRSPIFSADDQDLQSLAGSAYWYENLLQLKSLSPALQRAAGLLPQWREIVNQLPVHDLIDRIFYEGDLINRYQQASPPLLQAQVSANLQEILDLALQIDSGRFPSLIRFLARLKKLRRSPTEAPDAPPSTQASEKVRIMTIHAAKGLEAPVVFLADTGVVPRNNSSYDALVDWPATANKPLHFMLYTRSDQCPNKVTTLRDKIKTLQVREEANLLYVALSRAKNLLYISGSSSNEKTLQTSWYGVLQDAFELFTAKHNQEHWFTEAFPLAPDETVNLQSRIEFTVAPPPAQWSHQPSKNTQPSEQHAQNEETDKQKQTESSKAQLYGTLLHYLLDRLSPPDERPANLQQTVWAEHYSSDALASAEEEAKRIINTPALAPVFDPKQYDKAYKEVSVNYRGQDGSIVQGIIDRLVITGDQAWVIDFKTRRGLEDSQLKDAATLYTQQLHYYEHAVKKIWPQKIINKAILFTYNRKLIRVP